MTKKVPALALCGQFGPWALFPWDAPGSEQGWVCSWSPLGAGSRGLVVQSLARDLRGGNRGTEALQPPLRTGSSPASALVFRTVVQAFRGGYWRLVSPFLATWRGILRDESRRSSRAALLVYKRACRCWNWWDVSPKFFFPSIFPLKEKFQSCHLSVVIFLALNFLYKTCDPVTWEMAETHFIQCSWEVRKEHFGEVRTGFHNAFKTCVEKPTRERGRNVKEEKTKALAQPRALARAGLPSGALAYFPDLWASSAVRSLVLGESKAIWPSTIKYTI